MDEALAVDILAMPKRANTPLKADYSKHYRYHCNYGHSTQECSALKEKIKRICQAWPSKGVHPQVIVIQEPQFV